MQRAPPAAVDAGGWPDAEKNTLDVLSQVTAFSSGSGNGDYVVQDGDTLKSIA
jgi:hypothetical protein